MADEWREALIGEAFEVNPSRLLKRGSIAPFVPMEVLPQHARAIERIDTREYTGSGMRFRNGDTLIARITPCLENGKTAFVSGLRDGEVAHGSTEYIVLSGKDGETDSLFGYYLARTPGFRRYAIGHMEGTSGRQRVPSSAIEQYSIALPCFEEQRAIANILGTLDDKIELNRRMNQTLEAMACALFKSWFVDFDGVPAEDIQESEVGLIPKDWRVGSVYDIADVRYGAPFASLQFNTAGDGLPLVRIRDLRDERPGVWTPEIHPKGYVIQPGDIIVGMDGEFRAYLWGGKPAWMNQRVCAFHPKKPHCAAFVREAIAPHLAHIEATQVATTVIHLGKGDIDRFRVVIPPDDVARKFEAICQPIYSKIVAGKQQSQTLAHLRDTLLPRLISGDLRIPDAEKMAAGAA